ncbi:hypothetical protein, unlikely [Trypanosoma brucei gambiense DAL972]|uniref:Uncharacterized protein n=1 Tax=Trypanosoma brucei gambiense (strain MHOM/CI/86/DAL972) TaxID=679716 RepID=C9ZU39_TRYB9|nr:hypothetical protein, unlikely [Trypanosoma brucei gambiense DAL972]CBH12925.1 hypothetical protein, unlikely [Trypanosoma brucei gambiense DAL972]|eukprot:XP_011775204.1 hypothetical protein, unlikely [Trypanosoma brucei gambiense DAL972]
MGQVGVRACVESGQMVIYGPAPPCGVHFPPLRGAYVGGAPSGKVRAIRSHPPCFVVEKEPNLTAIPVHEVKTRRPCTRVAGAPPLHYTVTTLLRPRKTLMEAGVSRQNIVLGEDLVENSEPQMGGEDLPFRQSLRMEGVW